MKKYLISIMKVISRLRFIGEKDNLFKTWWNSRQSNKSMNQIEIIIGLDIGSTAVKVIIAETDSSKQIKVVGLGSSPCLGRAYSKLEF